jgi:hypothetical protein
MLRANTGGRRLTLFADYVPVVRWTRRSEHASCTRPRAKSSPIELLG